MVIRVDPNERRIGLSLKELAAIVDEPGPQESRRQKGRKRRGGDDDFDEEE
jgi:ribosomal protein S1